MSPPASGYTATRLRGSLEPCSESQVFNAACPLLERRLVAFPLRNGLQLGPAVATHFYKVLSCPGGGQSQVAAWLPLLVYLSACARLVPSDRPICLLVDGILVSCRSTACWLRDAFRYFVDRWFLTIRQYLASLFNICGPNTPSVPGPLPSALSARGPAFVLACIDVLYICTT